MEKNTNIASLENKISEIKFEKLKNLAKIVFVGFGIPALVTGGSYFLFKQERFESQVFYTMSGIFTGVGIGVSALVWKNYVLKKIKDINYGRKRLKDYMKKLEHYKKQHNY